MFWAAWVSEVSIWPRPVKGKTQDFKTQDARLESMGEALRGESVGLFSA